MKEQPFTPLFQRELAVILLKDPTAYGRYHEVWHPAYFDDVNQRKIVEAYLRVREMGKGEHPTETSIRQQLLAGVKDVRQPLPMDKEAVLEELVVLYKATPQNQNYSLEILRKFTKTQAVVSSLGAAIECVQSGEPEKAYNLIGAAIKVGSETEELENIKDLIDAQIDNSQNILGNRLLERGTFGVIIGHSGAGKSVLTVQAGVELAAGHPILGIAPARPLKVLVVQAEDSKNDRIDQVRCAPVLVTDENERKEMERNFRMYSTTLRGEELFAKLRQLSEEQLFDFYILNPAFAFLPDGAAAEESKDVSHFLRKLWLPFLMEREAAGLIMHHPPKLNNRDTSKWTVAMWQYSSHGSAEWTNAPRFSMNIEETASPNVFQFIIGKRGSRSGWQRDSTGKFARYFKYSDPTEPMYWKEATEDDVAEAQQENDLKIADILNVFEKDEKTKMSVLAIRTTLEADGFKVDNDWLVKKLERSPKFRKEGDLWTLEKAARQEDRVQAKEKTKQGLKNLEQMLVFNTIKEEVQISVNQLAAKLGMKKEKLSVLLEALRDAKRVEYVDGEHGSHLYSVIE